jgi:hypothetical protein
MADLFGYLPKRCCDVAALKSSGGIRLIHELPFMGGTALVTGAFRKMIARGMTNCVAIQSEQNRRWEIARFCSFSGGRCGLDTRNPSNPFS